MKKLIAILVVLTMCLSIIPMTALADNELTLYLKPNSNWLSNGARFAVLLANQDWSTQTWYDLTDEDGDGYYEVTAPANDYKIAIFCRMAPNTTENNWNNRWNQTSDLDLPTDSTNCYTVAEGTWDQGGGNWSVYTPSGSNPIIPVEPVYIVAGSSGLCGSDWNPADTNNQMTKGDDSKYTKIYTNVNAGSYELKVTNGSWDQSWPSSNVQVTAKQGATVTVTYDPETNTVTAIAEGGTDPIVPVDPVYIVAGSAGLCGSEWNAADVNNQMAKGADGKYTKIYTNVNAGTYELKVTNGSWDQSWPSSNVQVTAKQGATITVTYDPATNTVTAIAEGGTDPIVPVDPVYVVAGSAGLCGSEWNGSDDNNKMTKGEDGKYTKVYTNVNAGTYTLKVVKDGTTWIPDGMGNDIIVTALQGATVTVTYDPTENTVTAVAEGGTEPIVPVEPVYRVAGSAGLCGSEWNGSDDNNKMTKGEDGKYTKVYTNVNAGNYELKVVKDNSVWLPSDNVKVTAKQGATVTVTYDPETNTVTAVAEGGTDPIVPVEPVYVVAGTSSLCGSEWNATDVNNQMTKGADGKYTKVYTNVAAGTHSLKVVKDGTTWLPAENVKVTAKQGATVTVTYDPAADTVTAVAEGGTDPIVPVEHVYVVAGSASLCGSEWNATDVNNQMTKGADGKYTKVYTNVAAGTHSLKVVQDGSVWIPDGTGNDITVTAKQGATVTVTYDPVTDTVTAVAEGGTDSTPEDNNPPVVIDPNAKYYVAGVKELCGSEWNCADEANLMTVDPVTGKYSITYKDLVPNTRYAFKITNGTWDHSWPAQDKEFAVADKGDVTITFDPATGTVTLSDNAIKYVPALTNSDKLVVAGSSSLCGSEWNATDAQNQLVKGEDGAYTITYKSVAAGEYELKVVLNGSTWIGGSDGNNVKFTVTKPCDVTVSYTPAGGIVVTGAHVTVYVPANPTTGDTAELTAVCALMLLALACMAVTVIGKKKFF